MNKLNESQWSSTYSIVACDPDHEEMGVAVQTHQVGVGRTVIWAEAGIGVIATQSFTNLRFGPMALTLLKAGVNPDAIVNALIATDSQARRRQLAIGNPKGDVAAYTGTACIREAGHHIGNRFSVQANMMLSNTVIPAMREAFEQTRGNLATRLVEALKAAQAEGGDIRGMQSAALKVVSTQANIPNWESVYDIRVDEHPQPVAELERLVIIRRAQLINQEGHRALEQGDVRTALSLWKQARELSPDQEEIGFWQAVRLADAKPDAQATSIAARILHLTLARSDNRDHWLELITRLNEVGVMERQGAASELLEMYRQV